MVDLLSPSLAPEGWGGQRTEDIAKKEVGMYNSYLNIFPQMPEDSPHFSDIHQNPSELPPHRIPAPYMSATSLEISNLGTEKLPKKDTETLLFNNPELNKRTPSSLFPRLSLGNTDRDSQTLVIPTNTLSDMRLNHSTSFDSEHNSANNRPSILDLRKQSRRIRKRKDLCVQPEEFLPELLTELSSYHYKHTIRVGWKYQADIPEPSGHLAKEHKLVHLRRPEEDFSQEVFNSFKKLLGENRNQEELCMIKTQLNCGWRQLPRYLEANKDLYKKHFKEKDKPPRLSKQNSKD